MFTQTTILALRALVLIALDGSGDPLPPRRLAGPLACSPTYLGKTLAMLTRAGILRSSRGAHGGVWLARSPDAVRLLDVVEACQGVILPDYCDGDYDTPQQCSFHRVMRQVHERMVGALSAFTLADLLAQPRAHGPECHLFLDGALLG